MYHSDGAGSCYHLSDRIIVYGKMGGFGMQGAHLMKCILSLHF